MAINKFLSRIGLSWHDIFIVLLLFETCWWGMFAFMDSADMILRAIEEGSKTEYHVFVLVQKCLSLLKIIAVVVCLWYGSIFSGKGIYPRMYLVFGMFVDTMLTLSWIMISTEESWPLSPTNIYGLHYIITFVLLRAMIYCVLYMFIKEVFVTPFGPPVVGTANGTVLGIPEQGSCRSVNCGSNLGYLGKGLKATLEYYRLEIEQAFMIAIIWDVFWNLAVIISQELPEVAFSYVFVGTLGSVALNVPTDDLFLRFARILLGMWALYLVVKKSDLLVKIWICIYTSVMIANIVLLCYIATSALIDETTMSSLLLCTVFFGSNLAKIFVIYCSLRYYMHLRQNNESLINENNNEN